MSVPDHIARLFAILGASKPNWNVTAATIEVWSLALYDVDPDSVLAAGWQFVRATRFDPTVSEIRALALRQTVSENADVTYLRQTMRELASDNFATKNIATGRLERWKLSEEQAREILIKADERRRTIIAARARGEIDGHEPKFAREEPKRALLEEHYE